MRSKIICNELQMFKVVDGDHHRRGTKNGGCDESACAQCVDKYVSQDILAPKCMFCHKKFELSALLDHVSVWRFKKLLKLDRDTRLQAEIVLLKETLQILEEQRQPQKIGSDSMTVPTSVLPSLLNLDPNSSLDDQELCDKCLQPFPYMFRTKCLEHECDEDVVSCVSLLRTKCKFCPKCKVVIEKEEGGCDQMFCVMCKSLFSWKTGRLVTEGEPRHNPHYYEWERKKSKTCERHVLDNPREGLFLLACTEKFQNENLDLSEELNRAFFGSNEGITKKGLFLLLFQEMLVNQQVLSLRLLEEDARLRFTFRERFCLGYISFNAWKSKFRAYCNTVKRDTDLKNFIFEVLERLYEIVLDQEADSRALQALFSFALGNMYSIANRYGRTVVYSVRGQV